MMFFYIQKCVESTSDGTDSFTWPPNHGTIRVKCLVQGHKEPAVELDSNPELWDPESNALTARPRSDLTKRDSTLTTPLVIDGSISSQWLKLIMWSCLIGWINYILFGFILVTMFHEPSILFFELLMHMYMLNSSQLAKLKKIIPLMLMLWNL